MTIRWRIIGWMFDVVIIGSSTSLFVGIIGWIWSANNIWPHLVWSSLILLAGNLFVYSLVKGYAK